MKTQPLNNCVLIEVMQDYEGVSRNDASESMKYGKLIDYSLNNHHLTASSAHSFTQDELLANSTWLDGLKGKIVRWEEFAEGGQTFEEEGKTYALVPWWRLISVTEE